MCRLLANYSQLAGGIVSSHGVDTPRECEQSADLI